MADDSTSDTTSAADERLSNELGLDVLMLEQHVRFRLDLTRMHRGEATELGYLFVDRQEHPNTAIVFASPREAQQALQGHPLVESLTEEDCLDAYIPAGVGHADLIGREIFLP